MIICDLCKKLPKGSKNAPFDIAIAVTKMEETATGKKQIAKGREIINIPMTLCDSCISIFNQRLGQLCQNIRLTLSVEEQAQANAEKLSNNGEFDLSAEEGFAQVG